MDVDPPQAPHRVVDPIAELIRDLFSSFLEESVPSRLPSYVEQNSDTKMYLDQISDMVAKNETSLFVNFMHVSEYQVLLADYIEAEYVKYEPSLTQGLRNVVIRYHDDYLRTNSTNPSVEFWVHFYNLPNLIKLRELRSSKIGKLTSFCGTVTRTTEVHPELLTGSFVCLDCQAKIPNIEQRYKYTQPEKCSNTACENTKRWRLELDASRFADWQKIRVQENSGEIPSGSMPRHIEVVLRHTSVEKAKAGDRCVFVGTLIVIPDLAAAKLPGGSVQLDRQTEQAQTEGEGIAGLKDQGVRPLTFRLAFLASTVRTVNSHHLSVDIREDENASMEPTEQEVLAQFSDDERLTIHRMRHEPNLYRKMARSIAPAIFGHEEVKKGILLMLFGGVHKRTNDGINLRGDINICVVGDPSVAKSQFLKYVTSLVPRAVYTSGKASTAAGLTATVVKDPETSEYNIEAGALMLADSGICCIDEFDKMDSADQVAIHEAMEQQTISISKAGIHATLNARTSILAAANPIGGRYDKGKSLKANLTITPAIMSRFDLLFVVLDKNDESTDLSIAKHIVGVHQKKDSALTPDYTQQEIQRYIRFARTIKPIFLPNARKQVTKEYCNLRMSDQSKGKTSWRITVRQLESMIRLSEAIARVHLEYNITEAFVEEAARLLRQSIINVHSEDVELEQDIRPIPSDLPSLRKLAEPDADNENANGNHDDDDNAGNRSIKKDPQDQRSREVNDEADAEDRIKLQSTSAHDSEFKEKTTKKKTKTKISREEYQRIKGLLLFQFHRRLQSKPDDPGITQKELIDLEIAEYVAAGNTNPADIKSQRALVAAVISKLIQSDRALIVAVETESIDDRVLVTAEGSHLEELSFM